MEAMKKLDADLVALFATAASAEPLKIRKQQEILWPEAEPEQIAQDSEDDELVMTPELFRSCNALQLHLEALTLQPEGTQRMELVQNEVRPIFTVECQLSGDLIRKVPRQPMFHIMQFESEKFQSLTQCTRFGQTAERQVDMEDKTLQDPEQSAGHVDITVWWREPGTCLNEMLGMGRLELRELYKASLLEQCKCIAIRRRDVHLGSVYLKISLLQSLNGSRAKRTKVETRQQAVLTPPQPPAPPPPPPQSNNNSKAILECINFMAETNKVRLLRGYLYAGELRQLTAGSKTACQELSLEPFWQPQPLLTNITDGGSFELQEQFAIINDERFLQSVERQQLVMELRPLGGVVRLPLHQFFIAYRDSSITNHLCKGKLPVISIDGWAPIVSAENQTPLGELKVLLAIGSESQIAQLKQLRGFDPDNNQVPAPSRTTDLLDMLQNAIAAPTPSIAAPVMPPPPAPPAPSTFSFQLRIVGAAGLPLNPGYGKSKKQVKRQSAAKRFPPNEPPNTYVTFQAISCNSQTYKSHEGLVYATPIVPKSTKPQWLSKFRVDVSRDYRSNPQKLFILKLWKKAVVSPSGITEPSPHEDAIIGFAALNLNQKQAGGGFPSGWHNIVDFNGRVTGGIEAHVEPISPSVDNVIDQFEKSMELGHLQLGQAIKRKYTELEEISQRLRSRLVDVTGETLKFTEFDVDSALDSWQQEGDDDDLAEDFERSLRTPTPPGSPTPSTSSAAQNLRNSNGQE
ncbi:GM22304 [Drosophila sechellia]|uniref:GM22304 n=1 Tax=Drosophila sechellia TaxID=7238 RepID=B4IAC6_DROSE|nr:GM22304 [Drosophila sechellia]